MRTTTYVFACSVAVAALAIPASAQTTDSRNNSAVKSAHTVNAGGARRGANSFTEGQARGHIRHSGFTGVSKLRKDRDGIWRGTAMKGGHRIPVAVDFKGNVTTGGQ